MQHTEFTKAGYDIVVADMTYDVTDHMGEYVLEDGEFGGSDDVAYYSDQFLKDFRVTDIEMLNEVEKEIKIVMVFQVISTAEMVFW